MKQNNFDENFFKEINSECQAIKDNLNALDGRENFNADIMFQEVEAAIQKIKAGKSPGPDSFYPELFQNAGENYFRTISECYTSSTSLGWKVNFHQRGKVPMLNFYVNKERVTIILHLHIGLLA